MPTAWIMPKRSCGCRIVTSPTIALALPRPCPSRESLGLCRGRHRVRRIQRTLETQRWRVRRLGTDTRSDTAILAVAAGSRRRRPGDGQCASRTCRPRDHRRTNRLRHSPRRARVSRAVRVADIFSIPGLTTRTQLRATRYGWAVRSSRGWAKHLRAVSARAFSMRSGCRNWSPTVPTTTWRSRSRWRAIPIDAPSSARSCCAPAPKARCSMSRRSRAMSNAHSRKWSNSIETAPARIVRDHAALKNMRRRICAEADIRAISTLASVSVLALAYARAAKRNFAMSPSLPAQAIWIRQTASRYTCVHFAHVYRAVLAIAGVLSPLMAYAFFHTPCRVVHAVD